MRLNFVPTHVFRETPQVSFFDAGVKAVSYTHLTLPTILRV